MKTPSNTAIPGVSVSSRAAGANWRSAEGHGWSGEILGTLRLWFDRARQRRQLSELDDRLLTDIGMNRFDAGKESSKPFWQA